MVWVQNKSGTSDEILPSGYFTWIDVWESVYGKAQCCSFCSKTSNLVGAHVFIVGETQKGYIVPLCCSCNSSGNLLPAFNANLLLDITNFKASLYLASLKN